MINPKQLLPYALCFAFTGHDKFRSFIVVPYERYSKKENNSKVCYGVVSHRNKFFYLTYDRLLIGSSLRTINRDNAFLFNSQEECFRSRKELNCFLKNNELNVPKIITQALKYQFWDRNKNRYIIQIYNSFTNLKYSQNIYKNGKKIQDNETFSSIEDFIEKYDIVL